MNEGLRKRSRAWIESFQRVTLRPYHISHDLDEVLKKQFMFTSLKSEKSNPFNVRYRVTLATGPECLSQDLIETVA